MSRGATARLFVAVDPPGVVCAQLAMWAHGALTGPGWGARGAGRAIRLLEAQAMHVTLCFLGSRPVAEIEALAAALRGCEASTGEVQLGAPLWLPPRRPRTLSVEVHDRAGSLARLHGSVSGAIARAIDWQPERRRFRAHVTVARIGREARGGGRAKTRGRAPDLPATPQLSFTPSALVLYRSWLAPAGASYEALETRMLMPSESNSSAGEEIGSVADGATHTSIEALERVGLDPSSHSGSEPSPQE
jgi:2'-5' RNA ligase